MNPDQVNEKIMNDSPEEKAADAFKDMLLQLGHTQPVILYGFQTKDNIFVAGSTFNGGYVHAVGAATCILNDLLNNPDNDQGSGLNIPNPD